MAVPRETEVKLRVASAGAAREALRERDAAESTRRAREERLRISEEMYRSVTATISDGLFVVAAGGAIVACNPSACEARGVTADQLIGHRLSQLGFALHDDDDRPVPMTEHPVRRVLRGGESVREEPHQLHRPDGSVRIVGRRATDLIKCGGYKVGAGEVEAALLEHPEVKEAAVLGKPDPDLGERIVAYVVARAPVEPKAL